ncbi:hypothetical protein NQ315_015096 [Exocentrus adspersus]|uniref:Uncharacterized protein n=1 Tax=Exocentrus adspersus TaxID=1586481 RepID=A0AAV8VYU5_9CUCU|nr:hypothetical protein NQ315_015096 [Exocentrus adspersus]
MFGGKLRSWMEAVRPRKKQHRKDKSTKIINTHVLTSESKNFNKREELDNAIILPNDFKENDSREIIASNASKNGNTNSQSSATGVSNSRYSANNLSSPESAYSTGYSTDGTSPGGPPDYLINNSSTHPDRCNLEGALLNSSQLPNSCNRNSAAIVLKNSPQLNHLKGPRTPILQIRENGETKTVAAQEIIGVPSSPSMGITSPRQRNRIRTNPWLPSNIPSPTPMKHYSNKATLPSKIRDSPRSRLFLSTVISRRHSLSSSSCSSLSGTGLSLDHSRPRSASDEEDCTLNEMMGKYDESYVYEKETDILSDSDPTDCETDIDTGQDGGDEDEPFEGELDFIDNGSHLEFDSRFDRNTGHCSYYNYDNSKKRSSRRRTTPTPLSVRRADHRAISKLALEECLKRRSNSVSFYNNHINTIDKRDKEADLKYKELIVEAEQILRTMKTNGLSPRRIPGPANKRVEHLRITEGTKVDVLKYRPVGFTKDNPADTVFSKRTPSNHTHSGTRFSPKKSHITNFLINNSSIVVGKECEEYSDMFHISNRKKKEDNMQAQTNILHEEKNVNIIRASPRRKHYSNKNRCVNSSSDSDDELENSSKYTSSSCPQSEPVRRKKPQKKNKMVMFNLSREGNHGVQIKSSKTNSTDNLRQQVLLNTIANLKRNLEDQSASLKQSYFHQSYFYMTLYILSHNSHNNHQLMLLLMESENTLEFLHSTVCLLKAEIRAGPPTSKYATLIPNCAYDDEMIAITVIK